MSIDNDITTRVRQQEMGPAILGIRVGEIFHIISSAAILHCDIVLILSMYQLKLGCH